MVSDLSSSKTPNKGCVIPLAIGGGIVGLLFAVIVIAAIVSPSNTNNDVALNEPPDTSIELADQPEMGQEIQEEVGQEEESAPEPDDESEDDEKENEIEDDIQKSEEEPSTEITDEPESPPGNISAEPGAESPPAEAKPEPTPELLKFTCTITKVKRNEIVSITVQGKPNTEYNLSVTYASGHTSVADGLGVAISDANGYVSWTWKVGGRTNPGKSTFTVVGGGERTTYNFEVVTE